ncbi:MAG: hypothetical protein KDB03_25765 [Planctomycetales bacterium]|nr:hypothetical protein [Planctomycetales bacterium]
MNLPSSEKPQSPFLERGSVRLKFGTLLILLITTLAAAMVTLFMLASRIPAFTAEWNAWLGRSTVPKTDLDTVRKSQLAFVLCLYCAPLAMGMFVYLLHFVLNRLEMFNPMKSADSEEERFRMEN